MAAPARGSRRPFEPWPAYVDVLSTLLMAVIFVLMVFVIAQFFLSDALSGSNKALERLNKQVAELSDLLAMERKSAADLRLNLAEISTQLQNSVQERDRMQQQLAVVIGERDALKAGGAEADEKLAEAYKTIEADKQKIEALLGDIAALESLRDELSKKLETTTAESQQQLQQAQRLTEDQQREIEILNRQLTALRQQLARLAVALDASEAEAKAQQVQIADLGKRLNVALAGKVEELARYRSEFFGRLREVLGDRPDVRIVGDRFVFQSEVLFDTGSADLGDAGREQLAKFAATLNQIAAEIPSNIDWVLRVDGHTDKRPISTPQFASNWELSTARAIAVVKFMEAQGVPPERLVAAGYGEYQPLDPADTEDAYRRNRRIELKLDQR
ncbi:MAG: peptidoglycan -binding protein [Pseudomonadota bacterium]